MIHFISGDFFNFNARIRINTVNCVGVMGAGIALGFKQLYPEMFREYQKLCSEGKIKVGELYVWENIFGECVVNFPTKVHWRNPSRYEYVEAGLKALRQFLSDKGEVKVALPALGCGHGGLDFEKVSLMISQYLGDLSCEVYVFTPDDSRAIRAKG